NHDRSPQYDMRSLFINLELMFRVQDRAFADHVRGYVEGEIARSQPVTKAWYKAHAGLVQRVRQFFAYLLIAVVDPSVSRGLNFGIDD
ncbi:MAG: phosphatidylserine/phosphatidylglycerophosphate/cardiolipin synthase family protein, partial [Sphingomonas sp.]